MDSLKLHLFLVFLFISSLLAKGFDVNSVIHPVVRQLPTPQIHESLVSISMAISTNSSKAEVHFEHGLAHLNAAWDFEAYRHFCEAAKADPECLMAYWGICLSLTSPNIENAPYRAKAFDRMLDLTEAQVATKRERAYALAAGYLFSETPYISAKAFKKIHEKHPNDLLAELLGIFLSRDGYSEFGDVGAGQETAIREMDKLITRDPNNQAILCYWTMLHAEHPEGKTTLRERPLSASRLLTIKKPFFAPYRHMRGHMEYRCGSLRTAEAQIYKANELYQDYMEQQGVSYYDCPAWVQCKLYTAQIHHSLEEEEQALKVAKEISSLPIDEERIESPGAALILWEGRTLPARLLLAKKGQENLKRALESLPNKEDPELYKEKNLAVYYYEALHQIINGHLAVEAGDIKKAKTFLAGLGKTTTSLSQKYQLVTNTTCYEMFSRALATLEAYGSELRGVITQAGPETLRSTALNWFLAAEDKQPRPGLFLPSPLPDVMELAVARHFISQNKPLSAAHRCSKGISRQPNHIPTLRLFAQSLQESEKKELAKRVQKQIKFVLRPIGN